VQLPQQWGHLRVRSSQVWQLVRQAELSALRCMEEVWMMFCGGCKGAVIGGISAGVTYGVGSYFQAVQGANDALTTAARRHADMIENPAPT